MPVMIAYDKHPATIHLQDDTPIMPRNLSQLQLHRIFLLALHNTWAPNN